MTSPGKMLGPYEVLGSIGAGGMGEVYRARDTRLGREVAIKVLAARFASDADRLRRFEQEARASAALNHPNILAIYDFGTRTDGSPYIASELLDGESLRDPLRSGPLPLRKAIDYSIQIARGLAAANDKGIVHRDLKPENLFITKDGRAKILDFGLAKLIEPEAQSMKSSAPTEDGTTPGAVLGTLGYMSPEQVRGRLADHRSDIFSLGAIIYEMVSGNRAFRGETPADTMSAILKEEPAPLAETNHTAPAALERIIRHCLEKNPDERFQSARDIAFDLEALLTASTTTVSAAAAAARSRWNRRAGFALAAGLILVAAVALGWILGSNSPRLAAPVFHQLTYRHGTFDGARFAPGGETVFYTASWEGGPSEIFSVSSREIGGHSIDVKNAVLLSISSKGELAILQSINPSSTYVRP
jgi:serine/threonine protein kinase